MHQMEYLSLQDIPHRHCEPQHAPRMASSHSSERPLGSMTAAVSHADDISFSLPSSRSSRSSLPTLHPPLSMREPFDECLRRSSDQGCFHQRAPAPALQYIHLPSLPISRDGDACTRDRLASFHSLTPRHSSSSAQSIPNSLSLESSRMIPTRLLENRQLPLPRPVGDPAHTSARNGSTTSHLNPTLTDPQHHHMRSSPPIQPGEQLHAAKLPSFSEFLNTTRAQTPPRTPSRRNGSADSSPHTKLHFDDVAWTDGKRRRTDTLGDIYARPSVATEHSLIEVRRMSSVVDPGLAIYGSPRLSQLSTQHTLPAGHQHRPSHSYPPPHGSVSTAGHVRQHSSPIPQSHPAYQQHSLQSGVTPSSYSQPMSQHNPAYEQRPTYYQDSQAPAYTFDRPHDAYYGRPSFSGHPHQGYDSSYGDIRFQQHVGLDHNAFNRKRRGNLPKEATNILKDWFSANRTSPYPTEDQKMELCSRTGLSLNQVSNWFINARRRAPQKELRERENNNSEA